MPLVIEDNSKRAKTRQPTWEAVVVVVVVVVFLGILLIGPTARLLLGIVTSGHSAALPPAKVENSVAACLIRWGVFGAEPVDAKSQSRFWDSIRSRITGINGFSESDGFHGDGTDWYELELTPELADELRSGLKVTTTVQQTSGVASNMGTAPAWWPKTFPADTRFYTWELQYLVLPDTGTKAWFMRVRT